MRIIRTLPLLLTAFIAADSYVLNAIAADTPMDRRNAELSVFSRSTNRYTGVNIIMGRYRLTPTLNNTITTTDNIFSSRINKKNDIIYDFTPSLKVRSDFDRHALNFYIEGTKAIHQENKDENYLDYTAGLSGRYDITYELSAPLTLRYGESSTQRGDPDERNTAKRTTYNTFLVNTGLNYQGRFVDSALTLNTLNYDYDNTPLNGGGIQDNQDRNRLETDVKFRIGLTNDRPIAPYAYLGYGNIDYDRTIDNNGINRSADKISSGIGVNFPLSNLSSSTLELGYLTYDPADARFGDVSDMTYKAKVLWEPSTLLAFTLDGQKTIKETTLFNASASSDSTLKVGAIYEITPSVFMRPSLSWLDREYEGLVNDELEQTKANIGIDYHMSENFWWNAGYEYTKQASPNGSTNIGEFEKNNFSLTLKMQF